jgi:carboxylesterase type B
MCYSGWLPLLSHSKQENNTADFLAMLNVSTIAEARELPSAAVINASDYQTAYSTYGSFTFGPAVDGKFVPANPGVLLSAGKFAKDVKIMAGHNTNEGVAFTDPSVRTDAQLETYLATAYPGMGPSVITYITKTLYPADYDGSMPYTNAVDRFIFLITESIFSCNTNDLARAFKNNTYAYEFEVFPALHANDLPYTFYNGGPSNLAASPGPLIAPLAKILQAYITNFAMTGDPNGKGVPDFPLYGKEGMEVGLNVSVSSHRKDPTDNPRCVFWQKSLFD